MYEQVTVGLAFDLDELPFQRKTSVLVEFERPNGLMTLLPANDQTSEQVHFVQEIKYLLFLNLSSEDHRGRFRGSSHRTSSDP